MAMMAEPMHRRRSFVSALATRRGVDSVGGIAPVERQAQEYTVQEWVDWYNRNPLSQDDMCDAVDEWKNDFPFASQAHYDILMQENTRQSKKDARALKNGAFKKFVSTECIHMQLAMGLLRAPPDAMHMVLEKWSEYMKSEEHAVQVNRSRKGVPSAEKRQQEELKCQVHQLRHKVRQMKYLERNVGHRMWEEDWIQTAYAKYKSGEMVRELSELTQQHGFGRLHDKGVDLIPPCVENEIFVVDTIV